MESVQCIMMSLVLPPSHNLCQISLDSGLYIPLNNRVFSKHLYVALLFHDVAFMRCIYQQVFFTES